MSCSESTNEYDIDEFIQDLIDRGEITQEELNDARTWCRNFYTTSKYTIQSVLLH